MSDEAKQEMADFWITTPHYLGGSRGYVFASPDNPVKVRLPAKVLKKGEWVDQDHKHPGMKKVKPEPPVDPHPKKGKGQVVPSAKHFSEPKEVKE